MESCRAAGVAKVVDLGPGNALARMMRAFMADATAHRELLNPQRDETMSNRMSGSDGESRRAFLIGGAPILAPPALPPGAGHARTPPATNPLTPQPPTRPPQ